MIKRRREKKKRKTFNIKLIIFSLLIALSVIFTIYSLFTILGVSTVDPLAQNIFSHRLLSKLPEDLEKTIFILEEGEGEDSSIMDVYALLTNPSKGNSLVVYLPGYMYFKGLEEDFGSPISISSLKYAGDFLQDNKGVEYSLWQINEVLGFRANNYVWITGEANRVITEIYGPSSNVKDRYKEVYISTEGGNISNSFLKLHALSSQYSFLKTFLSTQNVKILGEGIYSNLPFSKVLGKIGSFQKVANSTTTYALDLSASKFSTGDFSDLGGQIRILNTSEYDKALRRHYINILDRDVEKERVRVEVYNGTNVTGKAGVYARKVLNNGCDVVRFGNTPEILQRTQVYISDEKEFQNSLEIVSLVLFDRYEILEERPSFMTTGDIVVLLGEDILQAEIF